MFDSFNAWQIKSMCSDGRIYDKKIPLEFRSMFVICKIEKGTFTNKRQLFESTSITIKKNDANT